VNHIEYNTNISIICATNIVSRKPPLYRALYKKRKIESA